MQLIIHPTKTEPFAVCTLQIPCKAQFQVPIFKLSECQTSQKCWHDDNGASMAVWTSTPPLSTSNRACQCRPSIKQPKIDANQFKQSNSVELTFYIHYTLYYIYIYINIYIYYIIYIYAFLHIGKWHKAMPSCSAAAPVPHTFFSAMRTCGHCSSKSTLSNWYPPSTVHIHWALEEMRRPAKALLFGKGCPQCWQ